MVSLLLFLLLIIAGYGFVTNSHRVKAMAEGYLADLLGGRVEVGKATLSIFQGLRLEDVQIFAATHQGEQASQDAPLFSAQAFEIQYNPQTLLSGKLEATRIKVIDPRVHLTENVETGRWSFQRLKPHAPHSDAPKKPGGRPPVLPEIVLRNARVEYSQIGEAAAQTQTNSIVLEGQFTPSFERDTYHFHLQSRGELEGVGPSVEGSLVMGTNRVRARLSNFVVGPDVKAMLAAEVRKWVEDHQLSGAIDAQVDYRPADPDHRFSVQMDLLGVSLTVRPEEWMSADQVRRLSMTYRSMEVMKLAGLNTLRSSNAAKPFIDAPFIDTPFVDHLRNLLTPMPLHVDGVAGRFNFTQEGIDIENGRGSVENNGFQMNGHIGGYRPTAAVRLHVNSPASRNIFVPERPRYVASMPPPVREIYDRFKPQGEASFHVDIDRPAGGAPDVRGEVDIVNGRFCYEKFTYPVHGVTGAITLGPNQMGEPCMELKHIRGRGIEGGPNANADFEINGTMAPMGPTVEIHIDVAGRHIVNEPALTAAFPSGAQKAMQLFDPAGRGEFPKYKGSFGVAVTRERGRKSHWHVGTTIHLDDAAGALVGFPYPLSGVSGDLKIAGDRIDISNVFLKRGNSTLALDGKVAWGSATTQPSEAFVDTKLSATTQSDDVANIRPDLHIVAKNVPIDRDLLGALPVERRVWLDKLGVGGVIDVDGVIKPPDEQSKSTLNMDMGIAWRDGTLWPEAGTFGATGLSGALELTPLKVEMKDVHGRRGDAELSAHGYVTWPNDTPHVALSVEAKNLLLDKSLYKQLPDAARKGWDAVHPEGTLDAVVNYTGVVAATMPTTSFAPSTAATNPSEAGGGFAVRLTPRKLAATPEAAPYRLTDLTGVVTVSRDRVTLTDITGKHGGASVRVSGTGGLSDHGVWDLHLAGDDMLVDDDLRRAAPASLASLLQSLQTQGKVGFEFSKLHLFSPVASSQPSTSRPAAAPTDMDFAVKLRTPDASMDVGMPLSHFNGVADLAGSTRSGKLYELSGNIDAPSVEMAQRPVTDLHLHLSKPAGIELLQIQNVAGKISDGDIAGQMEWAFPDNLPSRYAVGLVLRGADVSGLTGEKKSDIHGRLAASLAIEGTYNDPSSRRGRGDVAVSGSDMYHIPLVLGLLQITNLALPITSPFNEATARYSIEGQRVTFEQIELRAREMVMQGSGHLDFDTRKVNMTFTTDNTTWPKLPIIGDLITGARKELLQIHVNGTLQSPKVSATAMNTFTTTVDQVLKGGGDSVTDSNGHRNKGY